MEKHLIFIPDPIPQVTIPEIFSVSSMVVAADCFLKVLMSMKGGVVERLRPDPSAELGKVYHSLLEEVVKGFPNGKETSLEVLEATLDRLLGEAQKELERDPHTASYADLTQTMTPLGWSRKRRSLVDAALGFIDSTPRGKMAPHRARKGGFRFENAKGHGRWVEVPISVTALRLKGRIDVLERTTNEIKIVDLKSGRVEDANGEVMPKIALQLRLYGIMIQTLEPKVRVTLVVNDGTEHMVPFNPAILKETKAWLDSTMSSLISGAIVPAQEHAKVGPGCRWCGIRHRCSSYLREAPSWWNCEIDWRLPLDTWGTVERFTQKVNGLFDLTLLDAGGRRIKIFRIQEKYLTELSVGKRVWFFDLVASRSTRLGNSWRHPLNFYEMGVSDATDRAWSLNIFTE